ncbi:hypothetical protein BDC45DRAFT_532956 [Circinella umbellata]|nr:hypothetical protein BDC45DRAFT_532956 [Circinella umbellata]
MKEDELKDTIIRPSCENGIDVNYRLVYTYLYATSYEIKSNCKPDLFMWVSQSLIVILVDLSNRVAFITRSYSTSMRVIEGRGISHNDKGRKVTFNFQGEKNDDRLRMA